MLLAKSDLEVKGEKMSDIELQKFFDFDEDDLAANRDCRLSPRQEKSIKEVEQLGTKLFVGTGILLILVAAGNAYAVILSAMKQGLSFSTASQNDILGVAIAIGIPGLLLGFLAWGSFKITASKVNHSVQQVRGRVNLIKVEKLFSEKRPNGSMLYRTVEIYELRVGKVNFENVNQKITDIIEAGDIYAFYYTKDAKDILSAEWIAKGN
jgi:hypothetical protein